MKRQTVHSSSESSDSDPDDPEDITNLPRRSSVRLRNCTKKPRFTEDSHSSSEEDPFACSDSDSSVEIPLYRKRKPRARKSPPPRVTRKRGRKPAAKLRSSATSPERRSVGTSPIRRSLSPPKETPSKFHPGSAFVVLKADIQKGVFPDLWKIDGKSLLQKYQPFEEGKETLYRSTSVYSGWTLNSRDQYVDAEVDLVRQSGKEIVVRLKLDIGSDDLDSD